MKFKGPLIFRNSKSYENAMQSEKLFNIIATEDFIDNNAFYNFAKRFTNNDENKIKECYREMHTACDIIFIDGKEKSEELVQKCIKEYLDYKMSFTFEENFYYGCNAGNIIILENINYAS